MSSDYVCETRPIGPGEHCVKIDNLASYEGLNGQGLGGGVGRRLIYCVWHEIQGVYML